MIIGIDGNEANVPVRVGIGEYAFELLRQFSKLQTSNLPAGKTGLKFHIYLKSTPREDLPKASENWKYIVFGPSPLWTQVALPARLFLENKKPNVFFSPSHYAPRFSPIPTAISIMDLSYLFYPELFRKRDLYQLTKWTQYSVKKAGRIFTISNASRDDIIKAYSVPKKRLVVTYPGIKPFVTLTPQVYTTTMLQQSFGITRPYFLFVGTLQPRKNIVRLIEAFSLFLQKSDDQAVDLILVGKKGWLYEEILSAPKTYGVLKNVIFLDFVSDDALPTLYKQAIAFILPSLYEGFGLPVLEAMKYGCPVITSNVSSLPEAGGDAALYVDPEDVHDIAKKMIQIREDKTLRKSLIAKGDKQAGRFSWEKTAKETLIALEELGTKRNE
jgi:glycosyltransferase involved in cell wall biosynthesis